MNYCDRLYGPVQITEPVIVDSINSPEMQRLKGIDQAGYFEPYLQGSSHSRFEHSLGVYILLNKFNAPLLEQIAGLVHDISHTAFSHCVDYALDSGSEKQQSYQDTIHHDFITNSSLNSCFKKYAIDTSYIVDDTHFPLKETLLPDLCADRIDYSLRTAVVYRLITLHQCQDILSHLIVDNNRWIFASLESGLGYARLFQKLNKEYYSGLSSAVMFRTVGDYLRYAIAKHYITREDLYTTDQNVLEKIRPHHTDDPHIALLFQRMNGEIPYHVSRDTIGAHVYVKSRIVDPWVFYNKKYVRVSDAYRAWKRVVQEEQAPKEYWVTFKR